MAIHSRQPPCETLASAIHRDFDLITATVLDRLRICIPADWLAECPHPILNGMCYHPTSDTGIQIHLDYPFRPSLTENSHPTDAWWAIVLNPYVDGNPHTNAIEDNVIHFGWTVH